LSTALINGAGRRAAFTTGVQAGDVHAPQIKFCGEGLAIMHMVGGLSLILFKYSVAVGAVLLAADFMGLPIQDPWFDFFVVYVVGRWALTSVVNGMPEPEEVSSPWYIWCYRSLHSMAHISTAYFSHKNMWKYISGVRAGGE
jgi:hypothetical protein